MNITTIFTIVFATVLGFVLQIAIVVYLIKGFVSKHDVNVREKLLTGLLNQPLSKLQRRAVLEEVTSKPFYRNLNNKDIQHSVELSLRRLNSKQIQRTRFRPKLNTQRSLIHNNHAHQSLMSRPQILPPISPDRPSTTSSDVSGSELKCISEDSTTASPVDSNRNTVSISSPYTNLTTSTRTPSRTPNRTPQTQCRSLSVFSHCSHNRSNSWLQQADREILRKELKRLSKLPKI